MQISVSLKSGFRQPKLHRNFHRVQNLLRHIWLATSCGPIRSANRYTTRNIAIYISWFEVVCKSTSAWNLASDNPNATLERNPLGSARRGCTWWRWLKCRIRRNWLRKTAPVHQSSSFFFSYNHMKFVITYVVICEIIAAIVVDHNFAAVMFDTTMCCAIVFHTHDLPLIWNHVLWTYNCKLTFMVTYALWKIQTFMIDKINACMQIWSKHCKTTGSWCT